MIKRYIFLALLTFGGKTFAQVSGMATARDSNMVKQLFFAGLRDKMTENYTAALTSFNKVIIADVNNDAAYFELANANLRLERLSEAESNIRQAIKLNPNNKWYLR